MQYDKRHILIIPSWYPKDADDISGSFFREQAIALSKSGLNVGLISPQIYTFRTFQRFLRRSFGLNISNDEGINTLRFNYINLTPRNDFLIRLLWVKLGLYLFKIYLRKFGKPDIIHVHSMRNAGYLALQIYEKYNIPYIITEHSSAYEKKLVSKHEFRKLNKVVNSSKYNMAVSEKFCTLLNNKFLLSEWHFIPNSVNNAFIENKLVIEKQSFTFLFVGNLNKNKSVDILLKAFSKFVIKVPDVKLKIIGDGPEKSNLIKLSKKLGIEKNIEFLGSLSREKVRIEMSNASTLVHPSRYETFGVVIIEALAIGLPVIATRCGGPESIITNEVGILIDPGSVSQLADALSDIYKNYKHYSSKNIRDYCIKNYSESSVISRLNNVIENTI